MILRPSSRESRPGNVIVLVALMLTVLLGMVGYAVDGGMILTQKRECQATADAAAMAAACVFYQNYQTMNASNLANYRNSARTAAEQICAANGFNNDAGANGTTAQTSRVTVNFPPNITSGSIYNNSTASTSYDMNLNDGVVEVIVDYYQPSYFTKVWGYNSIKLTARAVARGNFVSPKNGIIVLDYTVGAALKEAGGGNDGFTRVTGGNFVINSNAANAVVVTGGGAIYAPEFDITGGVSTAGGAQLITEPTANQVLTGIHPTPDPFKYLQPYAAATFGNLPTATKNDVTGNGTAANPYVFQAGKTYTSIPNFTGNSNYIRISGTGMIGFDIGNNANFNATGCTISGQGVCIYMNSGQWTCSGTGCVMCGSFNSSGTTSGSFSGMTSTPLAGFSYFQPPTNTQDIQITGNGGFSLTGTVYAPNAMLDAGGNAEINNLGSQMVVRMMKAHGNGNVTIAYNGPDAAKTRVLALIE